MSGRGRVYNVWTAYATSVTEYSPTTRTITLKAAWALVATGTTRDPNLSPEPGQLRDAQRGLDHLYSIADQTATSLLTHRLISDRDFQGTGHNWNQQIQYDFNLEFPNDSSIFGSVYTVNDQGLISRAQNTFQNVRYFEMSHTYDQNGDRLLIVEPTDQSEFNVDQEDIQGQVDYYNDDGQW
ncbi:hypothetical protein M231_06611 [Tremella mesenterica]|uniref:Uncharacterized protein n=1 Tax=Tremella mesenterica TaxID=5217 RepID=A0A4V1M398_TREME|nr:hypothetical protein M231_06611 [Tremella mesenterica]